MSTFIGTINNDTLQGTTMNDELYGKEGNDSLYGLNGNDYLSGGVGDDYLEGGNGNDILAGDAGDDVLVAGSANNFADSSINTLTGGEGNDTYIIGVGSVSNITSKDATEGQDNIVIQGASSFDNLQFSFTQVGRTTNTRGLTVKYEGKTIATVADWVADDTAKTTFSVNGVTYSSSDVVSRLMNQQIDVAEYYMSDYLGASATGSSGNNLIYGGAQNDIIDGGAGNDLIRGGAGNDYLYGGAGADTLWGDEGDDHLYGGADGDSLFGGAGNDILYAADAGNGDSGVNSLYGDEGIDTYVIHASSNMYSNIYAGASTPGIDTLFIVADIPGTFTTEQSGYDLNVKWEGQTKAVVKSWFKNLNNQVNIVVGPKAPL